MKTRTMNARRGATAAVLLVGGGAIAAATWVGGDHGLAVGLVVFYVVAGAIAYLWAGGDGDVAAMMRVDGDERQRGIDRDAVAVTGMVLILFALGGTIVQTARSLDPGPWSLMCTVAGVTYCIALFVLRRRR